MCPFGDISDPNFVRSQIPDLIIKQGPIIVIPKPTEVLNEIRKHPGVDPVSFEVLKRSERERDERGTKSEGNAESQAAGRRGRQRRLICARVFRSLSNPIPRTQFPLTHFALPHFPCYLAPFHALSTPRDSEFVIHISTHIPSVPLLVSFALNPISR